MVVLRHDELGLSPSLRADPLRPASSWISLTASKDIVARLDDIGRVPSSVVSFLHIPPRRPPPAGGSTRRNISVVRADATSLQNNSFLRIGHWKRTKDASMLLPFRLQEISSPLASTWPRNQAMNRLPGPCLIPIAIGPRISCGRIKSCPRQTIHMQPLFFIG